MTPEFVDAYLESAKELKEECCSVGITVGLIYLESAKELKEVLELGKDFVRARARIRKGIESWHNIGRALRHQCPRIRKGIERGCAVVQTGREGIGHSLESAKELKAIGAKSARLTHSPHLESAKELKVEPILARELSKIYNSNPQRN